MHANCRPKPASRSSSMEWMKRFSGFTAKVPNAAFVVDAGGRLVFYSTWADSSKIEAVFDLLFAGLE